MYLSDKLTVCHLPAIVQDRHKLEFLPLSVKFLDQKYFIAVFFIDPQVLHLIFLIHCFTLLNALIYHSF